MRYNRSGLEKPCAFKSRIINPMTATEFLTSDPCFTQDAEISSKEMKWLDRLLNGL